MNSIVPFALSSAGLEGDFSVALLTFRWLLVLGFPAAVAAAMVRPDVFVLDKANTGGDAAGA